MSKVNYFEENNGITIEYINDSDTTYMFSVNADEFESKDKAMQQLLKMAKDASDTDI